MIKKLLPLLLALIGIAAGLGAGIMFKPAPHDEAEVVDCVPATQEGDLHAPETSKAAGLDGATPEYVKMNNQFVIPVVHGGKVTALVVLALSLEVQEGMKEETFKYEPKLRAAFNQVLFDHANSGGFDGVFTGSNNMVVLKDSLFEAAHKTVGDIVTDVLIGEIARQDV
jgi:hypothetical protein